MPPGWVEKARNMNSDRSSLQLCDGCVPNASPRGSHSICFVEIKRPLDGWGRGVQFYARVCP